jgi:hypothetical protein
MKVILIISLTVFLCSCVGKTGTKQIDTTSKIREILLVSKPDSIISKISDIAIDIEYIQLQLSGNSPIKAIDKIVSRGNKIYINLINNILCFDFQGNFLYQLYKNGTGNEENVVAIYDFDIDTSDSSLVVLAGNKLLHFKNTGSGFDYVKTIKLGRLSPTKLDFVPGTNKILLSSTRSKGFELTLHILINLNGDTLSFKRNYFKRFNPVKNKIWDGIVHYQFDNKLYLRERLNDTVFSLNNESDNFTPELILDSRLSSTNSKNINDPVYFKILANVVNILETPRYLYYVYNVHQFNHKVFYDKYENKTYKIDPEIGVLKDDIVGGPDFNPEYCSEGKIYVWTRVKELKEYIDSENFIKVQVQNPQKKEYLKKMAHSLKETDNPVLIIVTPKK